MPLTVQVRAPAGPLGNGPPTVVLDRVRASPFGSPDWALPPFTMNEVEAVSDEPLESTSVAMTVTGAIRSLYWTLWLVGLLLASGASLTGLTVRLTVATFETPPSLSLTV